MNVVTMYNISDTDYIKDGTLYVSAGYSGNVIVGSESDLAGVASTGYYGPGALAHTPGWANVWELNADGSTWTSLS